MPGEARWYWLLARCHFNLRSSPIRAKKWTGWENRAKRLQCMGKPYYITPSDSIDLLRTEASGQALFNPLAANFFALHLKILASAHFMQLRRVAFGALEPVPQARFHLLARRQ